MLSHCSRMCPLKPNDLDNDCPARMRFPVRRDRHDSMRHGCRGRHSKECAQSTTDRKRTRAYFPALAEGGGPETLDCPAQLAHPVYLRYLELRYRSEFQPSVHRDHCPSGNTGARGGWLSCTRNRARFVELRREPESATAQAGFLGTRRGSASAFLVFSRVYGTPESPAAIAGLLSWIPKIGELLLSAGEKSLPHELQMPAAKSEKYVR